MIMDDEIRIDKDIIMFEENIKKLKQKDETLIDDPRTQMAVRYYNDAKFYFEKKDYFTAFGCINYGHGLLDALLKF
jgi:hypothetical protein